MATRYENTVDPTWVQRRARRSVGDLFPIVLALLWITLAVAATRPGLHYYQLPLSERPFSEQHALLGPTGRIGHRFGVLGSAMMLFGVIMYAVRKRWRLLTKLGKLKHWLQFHIFLCTLGPYLVLLHTGFKIGGLVSIAFWSMTLVVLSGIFGRYVYARIPKSVNGQFRTLQDLQNESNEISAQIEAHSSLTQSDLLQLGLLAAPDKSTQRGLHTRLTLVGRRGRELREHLARRGVPPQAWDRLTELMAHQAKVQQQLRLLIPFQRLFRSWHLFHLPLSILMFLILIVHVAVAIMFGYGWPY